MIFRINHFDICSYLNKYTGDCYAYSKPSLNFEPWVISTNITIYLHDHFIIFLCYTLMNHHFGFGSLRVPVHEQLFISQKNVDICYLVQLKVIRNSTYGSHVFSTTSSSKTVSNYIIEMYQCYIYDIVGDDLVTA